MSDFKNFLEKVALSSAFFKSVLQDPKIHGHNSPERYESMASAWAGTGNPKYDALSLAAMGKSLHGYHQEGRMSHLDYFHGKIKLRAARKSVMHDFESKTTLPSSGLGKMMRGMSGVKIAPNNAPSPKVVNPSFLSRNALPIGVGVAAAATAAAGGYALHNFMNRKRRNKPEDELQPENKVAYLMSSGLEKSALGEETVKALRASRQVNKMKPAINGPAEDLGHFMKMRDLAIRAAEKSHNASVPVRKRIYQALSSSAGEKQFVGKSA